MPRKQQYNEPMIIRTPRLPESWWERIDSVIAHMNKHSDNERPPITFNWLMRSWIGKALQQWEEENLPAKQRKAGRGGAV